MRVGTDESNVRMALRGALHHLRREVDAYRFRSIEAGEEVAEAAAHFEYSAARRQQGAIHVGEPPAIVAAPRRTSIAIFGYAVPVREP
jgi:hypothetical protein